MSFIPVVFACDNDYVPLVTTVSLSILEHTESSIDFYLICPDLSHENQKILTSFFNKQKQCRFFIIPINQKDFCQFPVGYHYSYAMYVRFLLPLLLPNLSKIIYSDVDVIYCDDIRKMYDIDIKGFGLAAPIEEIGAEMLNEWNHKKRKKNLNISKNHLFFQSGNLVIDLDYWRTYHISDQLMMITHKQKDILVAPDLDVLNIVFANNYYRLPYRYSLCTHRIGYENNNSEMIVALKTPFCIHYAGRQKPWLKNDVPFAKKWWCYARLSPYYILFLRKYHQSILCRIKCILYKIVYKVSWGKTRYYYKKIYKNHRGIK